MPPGLRELPGNARGNVQGVPNKASREGREDAKGTVYTHYQTSRPSRLREREPVQGGNRASRKGREVKLPVCTAQSSRSPAWLSA